MIDILLTWSQINARLFKLIYNCYDGSLMATTTIAIKEE